MASRSVLWPFILATVFLLMGTTSSVLGKIMYQTVAPIDNEGDYSLFKKPWYQVWLMFAGMILCGPMLAVQRMCHSKKKKPLKALATGKPLWKVSLIIGIPAVCDLLATMLQNVALLFTNVSIWQMLRGSTCIFAAGQRYLYLGKRVRRHELLGIALVTVGLVVVGASSIISPSSAGANAAPVSTVMKFVGIACVLCAQCMQAFQTVVEEELLHDIESDAFFIVALEGVWGLILCSVFFMPIAQMLPGVDGDGVHENVWPEEFYMVLHSPFLIFQSVIYLAVVLIFNVAGMMITEETQATTRNVLDAARTLCVWVFTLLMDLIAPQYGEAMGWFSIIEFVGFVILILGMFVYTDTVRLPCFAKQTHLAPAGVFASPGGDGEVAFVPASPKPVYSPIGARAQQNEGYKDTPVESPEGELTMSLVQNEH